MAHTYRARAHRASLRSISCLAALGGTAFLVASCSSGPSAAAHSGGTAGVPVRAAGSRPQPASFGTAGNPGAGSAQQGSTGRVRLLTANQSIIYTASLTIRAKNVTAAATTASNLATAAGGYVSNEQSSTGSGSGEITLQLKIPVSQYQATLGQLERIGTKLLSMQLQAQNVTQQVADIASQVTSAQDAITALRALLTRAGSVSELLSVQNQINAEESALEQLQAQQRLLAHQTSYATVSLYLVSQHARVVQHEKPKGSGFLAGLKAGWHALAVTVRDLLTAFGAALPIALAVLVLAGLGWWGWRRSARRRHPAAPPAAS